MDLHEQMKYGEFPSYEQIRDGILKLIDEGKMSREDAALVLPELRESEDERIRRFLIDLLSSGIWRIDAPFSPADCVAWLEKQKLVPDNWDDADRIMSHPLYLKGFDAGREVERVVNKQKPAEWSKEDEVLIDLAVVAVDSFYDKMNPIRTEIINFLKSLRPQPHWKPSEEQMEWLESAVKLSTDKPHIHGIIISLYEQLKRL